MNDELHEITIVVLAGLKECLDQAEQAARREALKLAEHKALIIAKKGNGDE